MRNTNTAGARCLQYLSVIIFFEMIALTVVKKEAIINDRLKLLMDHTNSKRSEFPMNIIFYHYYKHVFGAFVPFFKAKENVLQGFQRTFGYTLLAKWLVLFCKKEFTVYSDGRKAKKESIDAPLRKKVKMSQDVQEIKQRKNAKPAEDPTKTESTNKVLTYEVLEVKVSIFTDSKKC